MKRQAPPLEAIEAFILATRSESFRVASERLALSPSAFSRRIQSLEGFLGAPLFDRSEPGTPRLTALGERYRNEVEPALDSIRAATLALSERGAREPLVVVTPQSFAMGWLVPRLAGFLAGDHGIQISLRIAQGARDLRSGDADLAILTGPRDHGGLLTEPLIDLEAGPVAAPRLADGRAPPASLDQLADYKRLAVHRPAGQWNTWLENVGYSGRPLDEPTKFESMFVMCEAAAAGLGVALGVPLLIDRFLKEGRLELCAAPPLPIGVSYELVYADAAVRRRAEARMFAQWLRLELDKSCQELQAA